jgi:uncharacterized membrane protein
MGLDPTLDADSFYEEVEARAQARRAARRQRRRRILRFPRRRAGGDRPSILDSRAGRLLALSAGALAALTVAGLVLLWPAVPSGHRGDAQALGGPTQAAHVESAAIVNCPYPVPQRCRKLSVTVDGRKAPVLLGPVNSSPNIPAGAAIRVSREQGAAGQGAAAPTAGGYSYVDRDRRGSLLWLGLALALAAVAVLWWRGALALIGVALSLLVVTKFVVPGILAGSAPLLVAVVGSLAVMWVTLLLTNGLGAQTLAAALGIGCTLLAVGGLASFAIPFAHLDGYSGDISLALSQQQHGLSLQGVVLAGMVIGALGVLADTAVTQASAVMALRRANAELSPRAVFRAAFAVGRDHLSATIHTLVLAYVGSALPLLLVLRSSGVGLADGLNSQDVAEPVVAAVVGCLGLVLAVPLTTALASTLIARVPAELMPDGHTSHAH